MRLWFLLMLLRVYVQANCLPTNHPKQLKIRPAKDYGPKALPHTMIFFNRHGKLMVWQAKTLQKELSSMGSGLKMLFPA